MSHPRVVFVDVFIDNPDPLRFRVLPSPKNDPQLPTNPHANPDLPEIVFRNQGHPGYRIHFELQGHTHGYFFPEDHNDAVWSDIGTDCPTSAVRNVFRAIGVFSCCHPSQRRVLIVENRNPTGAGNGQGKFRYTLRVYNGAVPLNLDPPGDNTNGPSFYSLTATTLLVAGAVATATFFAVTSLAGNFVDDGAIRLGTALLAALTAGFGIAALWERFR